MTEFRALQVELTLLRLDEDVEKLIVDWDPKERRQQLSKFIELLHFRTNLAGRTKIDRIRQITVEDGVDVLTFVSRSAEQYVYFVWVHFKCRVPKEGL